MKKHHAALLHQEKQPKHEKEKPRYHFWQALFLAFYPGDIYVDVAKRWRGLSLSYFFFLIACFAIPLSVRMIMVFDRSANDFIVEPLKKLPPLSIQQGDVVFDRMMPYFITNKAGEITLIVDTTGQINDIYRALYPDLTWLITKNTIYFRIPPVIFFKSLTIVSEQDKKARVIPIPDGMTDVFIGKDWLKSMHVEGKITAALFLIYPTIVLFCSMLILGLLFAFAWLGQFFARVIFKLMLPYQVAFRVLVVALTPATAVYFGLLTLDKVIEGSGLIYIALWGGYFSLAVVRLKRVNKNMISA